ncbi:MAG: GFA family protein [Alphaproteobacteria bacterium]|nr:GFA family protein [Alphaproteobacteria bacterium]MBU1515500.1 GFA family protein [Alphaproteobacteria bacterium]MBU2095498.1 GFA family protein [Alphaproteobacteria bacterium]MBU2150739.1 GFA family protein [Alphaproteobacteria bacterium]MBU2307004.1 GFA family protein [Alphaproteobacteria bacterium]
MATRVGGCLCGAARYAVDEPLSPIQLCHCRQCRKAQGSAFGANIPVSADAFRMTQGHDALREYRASPGKRRVFCGDCGSPIFSQRDEAPDVLRLRVGSLDDDSGLEVGFHIQAASQASWCPIDDDRPAYPGVGPA